VPTIPGPGARLTPGEWQLCRTYAKIMADRSYYATHTEMMKGESQYQVSLLGIAGEFALWRLLGLRTPPKCKTDGGDGGVDLMIGDQPVDVKGADKRPHTLPVKASNKLNSSFYVLFHISEARNECQFMGWADATTVANAPLGRFKPDGPLNRMVRDLRPFGELEEIAAFLEAEDERQRQEQRSAA